MKESHRALAELIAHERLGASITVVSGTDVGKRAVLDYDAGVIAGALPPGIEDDLVGDARTLMENEQNRTLTYGEHEIFIETVAPQPHLLIVGAVHIGQALCRFATLMGYRVTVVDSRPFFTTPERFPEAAEILVGWPDDVADRMVVDRRTYVVILSHDARFEDPMMPLVLGSPAKYIGAMGSRRTHRMRRERLASEGHSVTQIDRIHGPVGLDIGAETPEEVAVSILAEMTQVRYGSGTGLSLRGREGRIHQQRTDDAGDV